MQFKKYSIDGRDFELRPLTQRQRFMASAVEQRLRAIIAKIATLTPSVSSPSETLTKVFECSVEMDQLLFAEDESFRKFLATILVPAEEKKWDAGMIDVHKQLMWEIDEVTQAEVLQDFLMRQTGSLPGLKNYMGSSPTPTTASSGSVQEGSATTNP